MAADNWHQVTAVVNAVAPTVAMTPLVRRFIDTAPDPAEIHEAALVFALEAAATATSAGPAAAGA